MNGIARVEQRDRTWKGAPLPVKLSAVVVALGVALLLAALAAFAAWFAYLWSMAGGSGVADVAGSVAAQFYPDDGGDRPRTPAKPNWLDRLFERVGARWQRLKITQELKALGPMGVRISGETAVDVGRTIFPTVLLSVLGWTSAADSSATWHERQHAERVGRAMGLDGTELMVTPQLYDRGARQGFAPDKQLRALKHVTRDRADLRRRFVMHLLEGARCDGHVSASERERIRQVAYVLDVSESELSVQHAVASASWG